jgi:hypothetical protein
MVFQMDDIPLLGIPPFSPAWGPIVNVATANGVVQRPTVWIGLRWVDAHHNPIEPQTIFEFAVVSPGYSTDAGAMRLSGMSLRRRLFTVTAPDGNGELHIAQKKNGIVGRLPVI